MTTKIAINGFGRIGRSILRILATKRAEEAVEIVDQVLRGQWRGCHGDAITGQVIYQDVYGNLKNSFRNNGAQANAPNGLWMDR